ncbi:unnamed protein product [Chironomus riparius]|uniref:Uncharacterized protein n=1 Tax=Chironomus riparius TaxID=315576 RepID=A0A9N9S678_9DIPT|nr:unnamed protein product [Chironomus riparius]
MSQEEINQLQSEEDLSDSYSTETESMDSDEDFDEDILELLEEKIQWQNKMSSEINQLLSMKERLLRNINLINELCNDLMTDFD